ncbi:MAG TPA: substrate-binding domain-containing protein [Burkholderiales bacterium]|nr:helix-turn-helix transcriptional regulator [Pseudomonadota bacterium]HVC48919.1 substrate-binding domain-containing protein [Burkholderiales bacterium]
MIEVNLKAVWLFSTPVGHEREVPVFNLLQAIDNSGKLTFAAREVGLSYRHAWDLLDKWGNFFGQPLVRMQQGRGAALTPLGEKLIWADKRVKARLTAQLTNLASELEVEINQIVSSERQVVKLHASHGFAVAEMRERLHNNPAVQLDLQYRGGEEALAELCRSECDLAGFHVPTGETRKESLARYAKWLKPGKNYRVIRFVTRQQGIMVKKGNPLHISTLSDLTNQNIRFVNREPSSGTRMLFDVLLEKEKLIPNQIQGYQKEELTHNAVAAYVASDMADAGFGVEAAARQFNLDFIPLSHEDYYLLCRQETLEKPGVKEIIKLLKNESFHKAINQLPGYSSSNSGEIATLADEFKTI